MQVQRILSLLAVTGLILVASKFTHACNEYTISNANLETMLSNVNNCYQEDLAAGIGKDSVARFLQSLLPTGNPTSPCAFPKARLEEVTNNNLYFIWPKVSGVNSYGMACLNFTTGESGYQQVGQNLVITNVINNAVCLYAFYSLCSQTERSIIKIIIVDKDIVGDSITNIDIVPRLVAPKILEKNSIQIGPNPFDTQLRIQLSLAEEAPVKFYLIGGVVGREEKILLLETVQTAGRGEWYLDLPYLPPGGYYGLLEVGEERQIIPLIKAGAPMP